ncbi:protein LURP-one-related 7 [Diospyros lotus]|uniref:protein LURP-one-related 7 n=1 Tax=Diospyros lotus TaxID=55363 RepID=UPI00224F87A5|nr:protein LURP-one-related 7 [Diospyros lotus]
MDTSAPEFRANAQIPIDLFISKKHRVHTLGRAGGGEGIRFTDASGNLVFRVEHQLPKSDHTLLLVEASGNPLIYIRRNPNASWQGFKGDTSKEEMIFRAERTGDSVSETEFEIFSVGENGEESKSDFKMKGSPFNRSCTINKGDSIVAQTSLMYKLGIQKVLVRRNRFRLTIFPGFTDHAFVIAALVVIFFHGRKLWI